MASNAEVIRRLYEAFARGDVPTGLQGLAPDIRWTEAEGFPYGGTCTGPEAVLTSVFMKLGTEWEGFAAEPRELLAEGRKVVALGTYSGTYKATGKRVDVPFAHAWTLRGGRAVTFQQYTDTAVVQRALS